MAAAGEVYFGLVGRTSLGIKGAVGNIFAPADLAADSLLWAASGDVACGGRFQSPRTIKAKSATQTTETANQIIAR